MSPSLLFKAGALALACVGTASANKVYTLDSTDYYTGTGFWDLFTFATENDPTGGYVDYQTQEAAASTKFGGQLIYTYPNGSNYMGVDYWNSYPVQQTATMRGRPSVRIESNKQYTYGLFVADLAHMPASVCGTWPAFWTVSHVNYPSQGEIDILENINEQTTSLQTLHTNDGCQVVGNQLGKQQSDNELTWNCYDQAYSSNYGSQWPYQGCSANNTDPKSYGSTFNANGGGVYAMEWTSEAIQIWNFAPDNVPDNLKKGTPDTSSWPTPAFTTAGGDCNVDDFFLDHSVVFDTTFCGSYAGQDSQWQMTSCYKNNEALYPTCTDYVAANPSVYKDAYWIINSLKVYQKTNVVSSSSSTHSSTSTTSTTSSSTSTTTTKTSSTSLTSTTTSSSSATSTTSSSSTSTTSSKSSTSTTSATSTSSTSSSTSSSVTPSLTSTPGGVFQQSSTAAATTTSAPSAGPTIVQQVDGCHYVGCWSEATNSRALTGNSTTDYTSMTVKECAEFCGPQFSLFGVEYGGECYCGDTTESGSSQMDDLQCDMPCDGDSTEFCGGPDRLNLYNCTGSPSSSSSVPSSASLSSTSSSSSSSSVTTTSSAVPSSSSPTSSSSAAPSSSPSSSASPTSSSSWSSSGSSSSSSSSSSTTSSTAAPSSSSVYSSSSSTTPAVSPSVSPTTSTTVSSPPSSSGGPSSSSTVSGSPTGSLTSSSIPYGNSTSSAAGSSTAQYSTSTVYTTSVYTITSCAATVTNCPAKIGQVTTETIALYTTICPVTATETSTPPPPMTTSTVYTTSVYTITSCAPTVTNCPAKLGQVTTETIALYTTICPVTATETTTSPPPPPMTTSTVYATSVYTITSCAPTVTNCPAKLGQVTTEIISLYTTVCPVTEATSSAGGIASSPITSPTAVVMKTETVMPVYSTPAAFSTIPKSSGSNTTAAAGTASGGVKVSTSAGAVGPSSSPIYSASGASEIKVGGILTLVLAAAAALL